MRPYKSESNEDYLEAILKVTQNNGFCRSVDIAKELDVKKPSVFNAVEKLVQLGYVIMEPTTKHLLLTESGKEYAQNIYERHLFFLNYFIHLGVPEDRADEEACAVEHDISQDTFERIRKHVLETNIM